MGKLGLSARGIRPGSDKRSFVCGDELWRPCGYDTKTGALAKEHELNVEFYLFPDDRRKLYLFSNDGKMHISLRIMNLTCWSSFENGERTMATPAFTDGKIVVRNGKRVFIV